MGFKKIALVTAIAAAPLSAFAMEDLTDDAMSSVTGQDGIQMNLGLGATGIALDVFIHDKDGLAGLAGSTSTYSFDGAIVIDNMTIGVGPSPTISIAIDAGDSAATTTAPVLNINVGLPAALTIGTGAIRVANSQRDEAAWSVGTMSSTIMNAMTIILGGTTLNIQLGNEAQTGASAGSDMAVLAATVTGGISITGFRVSDATNVGDGGIGANGAITILDNGGTDLNLRLDINASDTGLGVTLAQFGSAATGVDIRIVDQYLGTSTNAKIGDITVSGLNLNGATLTINGK